MRFWINLANCDDCVEWEPPEEESRIICPRSHDHDAFWCERRPQIAATLCALRVNLRIGANRVQERV